MLCCLFTYNRYLVYDSTASYTLTQYMLLLIHAPNSSIHPPPPHNRTPACVYIVYTFISFSPYIADICVKRMKSLLACARRADIFKYPVHVASPVPVPVLVTELCPPQPTDRATHRPIDRPNRPTGAHKEHVYGDVRSPFVFVCVYTFQGNAGDVLLLLYCCYDAPMCVLCSMCSAYGV